MTSDSGESWRTSRFYWRFPRVRNNMLLLIRQTFARKERSTLERLLARMAVSPFYRTALIV